MRRLLALPACWLLLWTLTGSKVNGRITIKSTSSGITLTCEDTDSYIEQNGELAKYLELEYRDEKSGEYNCKNNKTAEQQQESIYVKFRTCDNCIDLDSASLVGMAIGDVVATIVVGVAVYLVASQTRPVTAVKKSSTRPLLANEVSSNDPYQRLKFNKGDQKATYDVINKR